MVVDGVGEFASPHSFRDELKNRGVKVLEQEEPGMAASRRQVIRAGSELPGVKFLVWSEEKPSLLEDNTLEVLVGPIARNEADIVIYDRGEKGMASYNKEQTDWEIRNNQTLDAILVAEGLKPKRSVVLDMTSGPRAIRNEPKITNLFMQVYQFGKVTDESRARAVEMHKRINPERWSNSLFLPVIAAFHKGYRVASQPITYVHRRSMNESEKGNKEMIEKRKMQFDDVIQNSIHFIHYLKGREISRISPVNSK